MAQIVKMVATFDDGSTQEVDLTPAPVQPVAITLTVNAGATPTATVSNVANA